MHPSRAASLLALLGAALLLAALILRGSFLAQAAASGEQAAPRLPGSLEVVGSYTAVDDGTQLIFQQSRPGDPPLEPGWYSMPVSGGMLMPAAPPEDSRDDQPFLVRGGRAYVLVAEGAGALGGSPPGETLDHAVLSPNQEMLAFATRTASGRARLYVLYESAQLDWLGEEAAYIDLDWAPTSERLAFVSPRDGFDQVFTVRLAGEEYRQLTFDPSRKSSPRWSPDGRRIAYLATSGRTARTAGLATPTAAPLVVFPTITPGPGRTVPAPSASRTDVFIMEADGSRQLALTDTPEDEFNLAWLAHAHGSELGFAVRLPESPAVAYYYALPAGDASLALRRVYPPVMLEGITCPDQFPQDNPRAARITISNSGLVPLDLPLILRVRERPFSLDESADTSAVRIETVTLLPAETRTLAWEVDPAPGRVTHLSVITALEDPFPLYEQHCAAPNTYLGLPFLPFLPLSTVFGVLGLALALPRLAQRRNAAWWALWLAGGLGLLALTWIEIGLM